MILVNGNELYDVLFGPLGDARGCNIVCDKNNNVLFSKSGFVWKKSSFVDTRFCSFSGIGNVSIGIKMFEILKSTDNGKNWTEKKSVKYGLRCIVFDEINHVFVVVGGRELYYSADYGETWTLCGEKRYSRGIWDRGKGFVVGGGAGLFFSSDGKTWEQTNIYNPRYKDMSSAESDYRPIAYFPGCGKFFASGYNNMKVSSDGKTWVDNCSCSFRCMCFLSNANSYFGCGSSGIWKSNASGDSWTKVCDGIFNSIIAASPNGVLSLYACGSSGIWKSNASGDSWTKVCDNTRMSALGTKWGGVTAYNVDRAEVLHSVDGLTWRKGLVVKNAKFRGDDWESCFMGEVTGWGDAKQSIQGGAFV